MCALFGVWKLSKAAELTVIGLHNNQHRAIDFACIVSSDGVNLYRAGGEGLARQVFTEKVINRLHGMHALGHLRYPTTERDDEKRDNTQPIMGIHSGRPFALAHNGNLTNLVQLRELVAQKGKKLATSMDSECIVRLLEIHDTGDIIADLYTVLPLLKGSYALGILVPDCLIAVQDPQNNRPLSIGRAGESLFISSETCAFPNVGATYVCDVGPGTIVRLDQKGIITSRFATAKEKKCRFEGIYYAHPSSKVFGESVSQFRVSIGRELARLFSVPDGADLVTPIPDASNYIAMGFAEGSRIPYFPVIVRSHYVGRSFIAATQAQRDLEVSQKFSFDPEQIKGRRIVVVDDSIVRGTTLPTIVSMLRDLGAKAVHVRIGSPPITNACKYGINTPDQTKLISHRLTPPEICKWVGADSLEFLPLEALQGLSGDPEKFCFACMDGKYWS